MTAKFRDLLATFNACGVRYLVVGAYALAAHGVHRATSALDVWVEPSDENAERVRRALGELGAPLETLGLQESDLARPDQWFQLGLPPRTIDLMTSITGASFAEAWEGRLLGSLFEVPVPFLGRAELVQNRRAKGRPKDLEDLRALGEPV